MNILNLLGAFFSLTFFQEEHYTSKKLQRAEQSVKRDFIEMS